MGQVLEFPAGDVRIGDVTFKGIPKPHQLSQSQQYLIRHHEAMLKPRGIEAPIVAIRSGLLQYAIEYGERFEGCEIGKDYVIGAAWLEMARGYLGLLNHETGRLDCGTLDGELRRWAVRFGFTEEL